jgi:hypothetical protein
MTSSIAYVTYFDRHFLPQGLALYHSLKKHHPSAVLWILCFDDYTYDLLAAMKLKDLKLTSLGEFEDQELKKIKGSRNRLEYIWSTTPSFLLYVFKHSKASHLVYLDADLFFFSSPLSTFKELGNNPLYLVEHRFPEAEKVREKFSGSFNVGYLIFARQRITFSCLNRWRKQCIKACTSTYKKGVFGDQLYLNEWPKLYKKLVITPNLGVNTAPWNVGQYNLTQKKDTIFINNHALVCYHFHQFRFVSPRKFQLVTGYSLAPKVRRLIYSHYSKEFTKQLKSIHKYDPNYSPIVPKPSFSSYLVNFVSRRIGGFYWQLRALFNTNKNVSL